MDIHSILNNLRTTLESKLRTGVVQLLHSKHLYQSVKLDLVQAVEAAEARVTDPRSKDYFKSESKMFLTDKWSIEDKITREQRIQRNEFWRSLSVDPPDIKIYCQICNRTEPFNLQKSESISYFESFEIKETGPVPVYVQNFVMTYLCQSCKRLPEVFLVRRENQKLQICGRSPMEHVDVPNVIPKNVRQYFSNGIIAHHSGQTLAAVFFLRVLIEQWCRTVTEGPFERVDDLIDAYYKLLPDEFKSKFAIFRELYKQLSDEIHLAKGSERLFEEAKSSIVKHFEALKLFGISLGKT